MLRQVHFISRYGIAHISIPLVDVEGLGLVRARTLLGRRYLSRESQRWFGLLRMPLLLPHSTRMDPCNKIAAGERRKIWVQCDPARVWILHSLFAEDSSRDMQVDPVRGYHNNRSQ